MYFSIADLPDWNEKLGAGDARNYLRLHEVFRTSHPLDGVLRVRTCLATGEIKHTELTAEGASAAVISKRHLKLIG
jgi:hypothetical protein